MKLFLSSLAISPSQTPAFLKLVGKSAKNIRLLLIENAADVEGREPAWLLENRRAIEATGVTVERIDLRTINLSDLKQKLAAIDVIWLGGGNTFYLRWLLRKTGADKLIAEVVHRGKVYGGGSAGAVVAGPTLHGFEEADDPKDAPELVLDGLKLVDVVPVPHWDDPSYAPIMQRVAKILEQAGYRPQPIRQSEALVLADGALTVVG